MFVYCNNTVARGRLSRVHFLRLSVSHNVCRLDVRENGRQKVCIRGLLENKVHDAKSLVQVINAALISNARCNALNKH